MLIFKRSKKDMSNVGDNVSSEKANWQFSGKVSEHFDAHIKKSVPLYSKGHELVCNISDFFVKENSTVYEIGCSTGTLTLKLTRYNKAKPKAHFIGIDVEKDMIKCAKKNLAKSTPKPKNIDFICEDVLHLELASSDLIICYYAVQFIPPAMRQKIISKIYKALNWGGGFLLFEKTRAPDARFQDMFSTLYADYKLKQGYSAENIISKMMSLKGVLEPFSTQGNLDLLTRAGFMDIVVVQKYLSFEGFLAIK